MAIAGIAHAKALETWCRISQLLINVAETRELIICTKQDLKNKESQIHLMADLLKLRNTSNTLVQFWTQKTFKKCCQ